MRTKKPKTPRARNNPARTSLQNYFDRVSNSLEDRIPEYLQMKKYARVYEESQKLLEIEKALDIAAGSIFEISIDEKKLVVNMLKQIVSHLNEQSKSIKQFVQGKSFSPQIQALQQISLQLQKVINNILKIIKNINRINDIVPVLKALLKMKDQEDYASTPVLQEISAALKKNLQEPELESIKAVIEGDNISLKKYDSRLNFEHLNDASDKLIGLLNDKLLLVIGISETLIAGIEDEGINDVDADQRIPDELMVLFLALSILDIFYKIKEIRNCIKNISNFIKYHTKMMATTKFDAKTKSLLMGGSNNLHQTITKELPTHLKRILPVINEIANSLDALDLKLKLNTSDLNKVIRMTHGLIYEKANRIWENPYD